MVKVLSSPTVTPPESTCHSFSRQPLSGAAVRVTVSPSGAMTKSAEAVPLLRDVTVTEYRAVTVTPLGSFASQAGAS